MAITAPQKTPFNSPETDLYLRTYHVVNEEDMQLKSLAEVAKAAPVLEAIFEEPEAEEEVSSQEESSADDDAWLFGIMDKV